MDSIYTYEQFRALMMNYHEDITEQEVAEAWETFNQVEQIPVEGDYNEDRPE